MRAENNGRLRLTGGTRRSRRFRVDYKASHKWCRVGRAYSQAAFFHTQMAREYARPTGSGFMRWVHYVEAACNRLKPALRSGCSFDEPLRSAWEPRAIIVIVIDTDNIIGYHHFDDLRRVRVLRRLLGFIRQTCESRRLPTRLPLPGRFPLGSDSDQFRVIPSNSDQKNVKTASLPAGVHPWFDLLRRNWNAIRVSTPFLTPRKYGYSGWRKKTCEKR